MWIPNFLALAYSFTCMPGVFAKLLGFTNDGKFSKQHWQIKLEGKTFNNVMLSGFQRSNLSPNVPEFKFLGNSLKYFLH